MAEAVGLTLGVLALATAFKDCIDLFTYISTARSAERDYQLSNVKLDIEKTLLLQWAHRVRLFQSPEHDVRLDDVATAEAISKALMSVQHLLSDSSNMRKKYGLTEIQPRESQDEPLLSTGRAIEITKAVQELMLKEDRSLLSTSRKIRWAIFDKDKFGTLIADLSYFVQKLNQLVPDNRNVGQEMLQQDLTSLFVRHDMRGTRLVRDASSGQEEAVNLAAEHALISQAQDRILASLWFRFMDERMSNVSESHPNTFTWALYPSRNDPRWDSLSDWLRSGSQIYWMSGKAGSGKSTLMKYAFKDEMTRTLLSRWAGHANLVLASFFFWYLGSDLQKSHEGLQRALLFNILSSDRSLIRILFPTLWKEAYEKDEHTTETPTKAEMTNAFRALGGLKTSYKFCFFIDGLDEYAGDWVCAISMLKCLATHPSIKIVISSRPIATCVSAFSDVPQLKLQDLTRVDMEIYVRDKIGEHREMGRLQQLHPEQKVEILNGLVEKSSGVFLWVVLACRSIADGLVNADSISELRTRIQELPPELGQMFAHILRKIEPRHRVQAQKMLRVCFCNEIKLNPPLPTLGFSNVEDAAIHADEHRPFRLISDDEQCRLRLRLESRLRSRCWGLLEVNNSQGQSTVQYMHRSLQEFFAVENVWQLPMLQLEDKTFDANYNLFLMKLWDAATVHPYTRLEKMESDMMEQLRLAVVFAHELRSPLLIDRGWAKLEQFLNHIRKAIAQFEAWDRTTSIFGDVGPNGGVTLMQLVKSTIPVSLVSLAFFVSAGLVNFVRRCETTSGCRIHATNTKLPLLHHAISRAMWPGKSASDQSHIAPMVKYLLDVGCRPSSTSYLGKRDWDCWLQCLLATRVLDAQHARLTAEITKTFLHSGSEIDYMRNNPGLLESAITWIYGVGMTYDAVRSAYRAGGNNIPGTKLQDEGPGRQLIGARHELDAEGREQGSCFDAAEHEEISNVGKALLKEIKAYEVKMYEDARLAADTSNPVCKCVARLSVKEQTCVDKLEARVAPIDSPFAPGREKLTTSVLSGPLQSSRVRHRIRNSRDRSISLIKRLLTRTEDTSPRTG